MRDHEEPTPSVGGPLTRGAAQEEAFALGLELHRVARQLASLHARLPVDFEVIRDIAGREDPDSPPTVEFEVSAAFSTAREPVEETASQLVQVSKLTEAEIRARWYGATRRRRAANA